MRLLSDCERHAVRYVIRLKESWNPKVRQITRGTLTRQFTHRSDLDLLLACEILLLDGKVIDAEVSIGQGDGVALRRADRSVP